MLDKLRDAVADMMNKMKQPGNSPQASNKQNQKQDQSQQNENGGKKKDSGQQSKPDGESQNNSQGDPQSADAQGQGNGQDKQAQNQLQSGIGNQEGDKTARQAEELKAMGKLTEILGKRAANVTGQMMMEVGSTHQQIRTGMAQVQATHGNNGGELHRDEIPQMYEQFVQQYFEQIRKTPEAPKTTASKSTAPSSNTQ